MNRIKELRKEKHFTQVRLSIELEVSQEAISAYEKEKYYPNVESLLKLSKIFNASIDYILGLSDVRNPQLPDRLGFYERQLISLMNTMDEVSREKLLSYAEGLNQK